MLEPVVNNPWVRAGALAAAVLLVAFVAYLLSPVLAPLFFAFLVAYTLDPVVDRFEKRGVRRMVTIVALAVLGAMAMLAIPLYLLPTVIGESDHLVEVAQKRLEQGGGGSGALDAIADRLPLERLVEALGWAPEDQPEYDASAVLVSEIAVRIREGARNVLTSYGGELASFTGRAGSSVAGLFAAIGRGLMGAVLALGNLALFTFVAGYLLKDYDEIVAVSRDLVPPRYRDTVFRLARDIDGQLRGFLRGQGLVCLALGIMYGIGLLIADVPFALVLGIFGGIASFVPYLGLVLTIGPAVVLCLVQHGGFDWHFAVVVATFVIAQTLEGTVITPKVVGDQVGLGPVWVILAVLVFGSALGFLGLLLAVPIAATLKVLVLEGLNRYRASSLFQESATD